MPDERKGVGLTTSEFAALLERLDQVMLEAQRLREQVTRQLTEQRRSQQQRISPRPRRRKSPKRR
jgi:hypothetical protein